MSTLNDLKINLMRNIRNLTGWCTDRKIVVIESDDWGSIRMPSREIYELLTRQGVNLLAGDALRYNLYDSLATAEDIELLFETLSKFKDKNGNPCAFTAVSVVVNPNFAKIKACNFREYSYEPFTETLKRYPGCERSFDLWKEGIRKKIFVPQSHGREHLNVTAWMNSLRAGHPDTLLAFAHGFWGFTPRSEHNIKSSFQAAFDFWNVDELIYHETVIAEGLKLFENLFGYRASFFVAPNGAFNNQLVKDLARHGIRFMAVSRRQAEPQGRGKIKTVFHCLGQRSKDGILYLTRNCIFEPSQSGKDWVDSCLKDIKIAFRWNKPAIISSHRVNYIGAIDPANRDKGLTQLKLLLSAIVKRWPKAEFMTSNELGNLISGECGITEP